MEVHGEEGKGGREGGNGWRCVSGEKALLEGDFYKCIFCDTKHIMVAHKDGRGPLHLISHSIDLQFEP